MSVCVCVCVCVFVNVIVCACVRVCTSVHSAWHAHSGQGRHQRSCSIPLTQALSPWAWALFSDSLAASKPQQPSGLCLPHTSFAALRKHACWIAGTQSHLCVGARCLNSAPRLCLASLYLFVCLFKRWSLCVVLADLALLCRSDSPVCASQVLDSRCAPPPLANAWLFMWVLESPTWLFKLVW